MSAPVSGLARLRAGATLRPRGIAGQIALLVVAAIAVAHVVATLAFLFLHEPQNPDELPGVAAGRLGTLARLLDAADPAARPALIAGARSLPLIHVAAWDGVAAPDARPAPDHPVIRRLRSSFSRPLDVVELGSSRTEGGRVLHLGVTTPGGASFQATLPDDPLRPTRHGALIFTVVFLALTLALLCVWAARALTAPLERLAGAAEAFGARDDHVALPQSGPEEVLAVSRALDRMRARVRRLLDDRTQMLAAIGHDLRTPITRLRLRAEFIEDEAARAATLRDLDQMNGLVEAALSFVRDGQDGYREGARAGRGDHALLDLASVVQTVCDGFTDIGAPVGVERARAPGQPILVRGRPDDLQRAITNLVDNAVKYGGRASVRLAADGGARSARVCVLDPGPGIPEAERERMLQPFVRGDPARNLDAATAGFGLGLSIVQAIVEAHGGRLILEDRPEGGLCAAIELPLAERVAEQAPAAPAPARAA